MIGGGFKFNPIRLIKGKETAEKLPFDVALAAGYVQFNYNLNLDVKPESGSVPINSQQSTDFTNQALNGKISGLNIEAILSKKLLFFTPFLSVGYNSSRTKVSLEGNYPITVAETIPGIPQYTTFVDPVKIDQQYLSGLRANIGFQLNLLLLRLYASYSIAEYNSFNAGLGFGIGK